MGDVWLRSLHHLLKCLVHLLSFFFFLTFHHIDSLGTCVKKNYRACMARLFHKSEYVSTYANKVLSTIVTLGTAFLCWP